MKRVPTSVFAAVAVSVFLGSGSAIAMPSTPDLGKAEAQCRPGESGPAYIVDVIGLKDRTGRLKLEVYPANDADFLGDDNKLIPAGKTFRRVEIPVPASGTPRLCVRLPHAGTYTMMVLHDTNSNRKFDLSHDGIAFSNNPKLGWSKPKAAAVATAAGPGLTPLRVVMNYRRSLLSVGPIGDVR
jgi:uncharacterized protein (DUF2141 family)